MINNFISRVIVVINVSLLINTILIDSLSSSLIQITLIDSKYNLRHKFQTLCSSILLICTLYLLYSLCFNSFLIIISKRTKSEYLFFVLIPFICWLTIGLFAINLLFNKDLYSPPIELYHKAPLDYKKSQTNDLHKLKSIIKSKFTKLLSHDDDYAAEQHSTDLPWFLLNLSQSQQFELQLKYFKICLFTFLNICFYLFSFICFNSFACCLRAREDIS